MYFLFIKLKENANFDKSLKRHSDYLDDDIAKLKTGLQNKISGYDVNRYSSNTNSNQDPAKLLEEVKKLKNETFDKESTIYSMKIQLEEQTKNNKFLGDLCENLQHQLKR